MSGNIQLVNKVVLFIIIAWTVLISVVIWSYFDSNYEYAKKLAKNEAVVSIKKDNAYRQWAASHGGVYVPITKKTPANPYLAHIANRDVNTSASQELTLMNPAYIRSEMMKDYASLYGVQGHITSKKLLNPNNKPDAWEDKALETMEITRDSVYEMKFIDEEKYLRYISPVFIKQECLKCHGHQNYEIGDVRGGVSVSIPMKKYFEEAKTNTFLNALIMIVIWLFGLSVIFYVRKKAQKMFITKMKDYEQNLYSLVSIIENRDAYTAGHMQRVASYSLLIAKEMNLNDEELDTLYRACMIHDIGKISTPDSILLKPNGLTNLEFSIIKEHSVVGYELLKKVDIYKDIADIVRSHHERNDGNGYPDGLKGVEIPLLSRIMTVADAFDAMTTSRVYKSRRSVEEAILELNKHSGSQFDTSIIRYATTALSKVELKENFSQKPTTKIENERFSYFYKDQMTGSYNRDYLEYVLSNDEIKIHFAHSVTLNNFTQYNQDHSWLEGDKLLQEVSKALLKASKSEYIFRIYGDDFIILNTSLVDKKDIKEIEDVLREILDETVVNFLYKNVEVNDKNIKSIKSLEELF